METDARGGTPPFAYRGVVPALELLAVLGLLALGGCVPVARAEQVDRGPAASGSPRDHAGTGVAPASTPDSGLWREIDAASITESAGDPRGAPPGPRVLRLDREALGRILLDAPLEGSGEARERRVILILPTPEGTYGRFRIEESPILEGDLARRYPEIHTFLGQGLDDTTATTRFDWIRGGFHATVISAGGTASIEPSSSGITTEYIVNDARTVSLLPGGFECLATEPPASVPIRASSLDAASRSDSSLVSGGTLRVFRIAAGATAEYSLTYGLGSVSGALGAITTAINGVDAIFEREAAIRLVIAAETPTAIFTNVQFDPYTHGDLTALMGENQETLDSLVGSQNYDIGHVFDGDSVSSGYFVQGRASLGVTCVDGTKARGATYFYSLSPGHPYAVHALLHELSHQFSASHTFNGTTAWCGNPGQRSPSTAYEPGSGSTLMAYGTLCGDESLPTQDTYYHAASLEQVLDWVTNGGAAGCGTSVPTGNTPPTVSAGSEHDIPQGTPFRLTATGGDADGDSLTFCWEEYDLGTPSPPLEDDGARPILRSFPPKESSSRTFPQDIALVHGAWLFGEWMPTTTRTMSFRVTARDNRAGGGGVATDQTRVHVWSDSGPFRVRSPQGPLSWRGGSRQTISWDVAGTDAPPIGCPAVRISLSRDGGFTFPILLACSTPNDGIETVIVPNTPTGQARVRVEAVGNIFLDVSDGDFRILAGRGPSGSVQETCGNGIDDDCDGSPDASDPDCSGAVALSPEGGTRMTSCSPAPTFIWTQMPDAAYRLLVGTGADLAVPLWTSPLVHQPSFTPSAGQWRKILRLSTEVVGDAVLHWGVITVRGGAQVRGAGLQLTIPAQVEPSPMGPDPGAVLDPDLPLTFTWEPGECNLKFRVEFSDAPDGFSAMRSKWLTAPVWTPTRSWWSKLVGLSPGGAYWRITAIDSIGRVATADARPLGSARASGSVRRLD